MYKVLCWTLTARLGYEVTPPVPRGLPDNEPGVTLAVLPSTAECKIAEFSSSIVCTGLPRETQEAGEKVDSSQGGMES